MPDERRSAPQDPEPNHSDRSDAQLREGGAESSGAAAPDQVRTESDPIADPDGTSPDSGPRDFRALVVVQIGHEDDPRELIDRVTEAERLFDDGDFRAARTTFREVLTGKPSPEMRRFAEDRLKRIKPDRVALIVAAICIVALIAIWILATRAG